MLGNLPKCGVGETLDLNEFGHPVCFCNTEDNYHPLLPSLRFTKTEKNLAKCFLKGKSDVCNDGDELLTEGNDEEHLICSKSSKIVGFCVTCGIPTIPKIPCETCQLFKFGKCVSKRNC